MAHRSVSEKRAAFRELHQSGCFVLPNPWDAGSASVLAGLGFKALATTSSAAPGRMRVRTGNSRAPKPWRICATWSKPPNSPSTPISRADSRIRRRAWPKACGWRSRQAGAWRSIAPCCIARSGSRHSCHRGGLPGTCGGYRPSTSALASDHCGSSVDRRRRVAVVRGFAPIWRANRARRLDKESLRP